MNDWKKIKISKKKEKAGSKNSFVDSKTLRELDFSLFMVICISNA